MANNKLLTGFVHFGRRQTGHPWGVVSVYYEIEGLPTEERTIRMAFAFCSPKDKFNKKLARNILLGRAACGHNGVVDDFPPRRSISDPTLLSMIISSCITTFYTVSKPSWAKKLQIRMTGRDVYLVPRRVSFFGERSREWVNLCASERALATKMALAKKRRARREARLLRRCRTNFDTEN